MILAEKVFREQDKADLDLLSAQSIVYFSYNELSHRSLPVPVMCYDHHKGKGTVSDFICFIEGKRNREGQGLARDSVFPQSLLEGGPSGREAGFGAQGGDGGVVSFGTGAGAAGGVVDDAGGIFPVHGVNVVSVFFLLVCQGEGAVQGQFGAGHFCFLEVQKAGSVGALPAFCIHLL